MSTSLTPTNHSDPYIYFQLPHDQRTLELAEALIDAHPVNFPRLSDEHKTLDMCFRAIGDYIGSVPYLKNYPSTEMTERHFDRLFELINEEPYIIRKLTSGFFNKYIAFATRCFAVDKLKTRFFRYYPNILFKIEGGSEYALHRIRSNRNYFDSVGSDEHANEDRYIRYGYFEQPLIFDLFVSRKSKLRTRLFDVVTERLMLFKFLSYFLRKSTKLPDLPTSLVMSSFNLTEQNQMLDAFFETIKTQ
jgi:hypothetical protein